MKIFNKKKSAKRTTHFLRVFISFLFLFLFDYFCIRLKSSKDRKWKNEKDSSQDEVHLIPYDRLSATAIPTSNESLLGYGTLLPFNYRVRKVCNGALVSAYTLMYVYEYR